MQPSGGGETGDRTGAAKARVGNSLQLRFRHAKNAVNSIGEFFRNRCRRCFLALKQSIPNGINASTQRGNPSHTGNRQTHASGLRISREAFVPPNPNEFESATFTAADRASFPTMLRSTSSSGAV